MIYEKILFTPDECETILKYCRESIKPKKVQQTMNIKYDYFEILFNEEIKWLFDKIYDSFYDLTGVKVIDYTNKLSVNRYVVGNSFAKHIDRNENTPNRVWNIGLVLNNDFEGGEYNYFIDGEKKTFSKEIGNMIVYDSSVPHEVTKIINGERMALVKILDVEHIKINKSSLI